MIDLGKLVTPLVIPPLDPDFAPAVLANREFRELCKSSGESEKLVIAIERNNGEFSRYETVCFSKNSEFVKLNLPYAERLIKFLLWQRGGWKITVGGPAEIGTYIKKLYTPDGARAFDVDFMSSVYEKDFVVEIAKACDIAQPKETAVHIGGNFNGCRIGFDLGASDRKVSSLIDGKVVFTEEVEWNPRKSTNSEYHYSEVRKMLRSAAEHLPKVDAIGGSAAGVYINNRPRVASLFRGVARDEFESKIADMFLNLKKEWNNIPFEVVNDGEVTALAGANELKADSVLGIAMGSSEAGGYVNANGDITPWLNELAFCPVDYNLDAPADEWSGDIGCGAMYLSQQAVFRLAEKAGIYVSPEKELAARLAEIQEYLKKKDERAVAVWETIGVYVGYTIAHYADFYDLKHVLILGRVTSYEGGNIILKKATEVLETEFGDLAKKVDMHLPDEINRRIGQAVIAASLPEIK